ncbi:hypothetical protein M3J09_008672 [Ascochyta lentis]
MLSIQTSDSKPCTPHLLPARINHNGRINSTAKYWAPREDEKGTQHVHFRGRHLYGTTLPLPEQYTGAVLRVTDKLAQPSRAADVNGYDDDDGGDEGDDEMEERPEEVKIAEQVGSFDGMVVWGHGGLVDGEGDLYVRGLREWVGFAEVMHCDGEDDEEGLGKEGEEGKGGKTA